MNAEGMAAWFYQGDGLKLMEETYGAFNLVPRPTAAQAPQMAGWFPSSGGGAGERSDGIRVNCIVIGMVDTPIVGHLGDEVLEKRRLAVPLQTRGTGRDVGWAAVYLATEESRWVTGIELPIDAGQLRILERPR